MKLRVWQRTKCVCVGGRGRQGWGGEFMKQQSNCQMVNKLRVELQGPHPMGTVLLLM